MKINSDVRLTFNVQWYYQPAEGEKNSGISIVDPTGYVPAKDRIEAIMRAGENLDAYRREVYHYGESDEDDENFTDPMMEPGLDLADVHRMRRDSLRRLAEQAARNRSGESGARASDDTAVDVQQSSEAKPMEHPRGAAESSV